jgi:hypothetical protein
MSPVTTAWQSWWLSILDLLRQLSYASPEHERTQLARRIEATDGQIDRQVYELYGLRERDRDCGGGWRRMGTSIGLESEGRGNLQRMDYL